MQNNVPEKPIDYGCKDTNSNHTVFITFEGIDGSGKTTHAVRLRDELDAAGLPVVFLREPGATPLGERIRSILLDIDNIDIDPISELLLYEAARSQLVRSVIRPALDDRTIVLCDRFVDSTLAYQGYGRGISLDCINRSNEIACDGIIPDLTILFDLDPTIALARATKNGADRIEQEGIALMERVRNGYLALANENPQRFAIIDGSRSIEEVWIQLVDALAARTSLPVRRNSDIK